MHTVPISSLQRWLRVAEECRLDREQLLSRLGVSAEVLEASAGRATPEQLFALIRIVHDTQDDEMLRRSTHPVVRGTTALLARTLITSPDLGTALQRAERYAPVFPGLPGLAVERGGGGDGRVRVQIDTSCVDDPTHILNDAIVASVHRFAGWLIGRRIPLTALEMPYPQPPSPLEYDLMYRCQPTYGHDRAVLEFDAALLTAPVIRTEGELEEFIATAPQGLVVLYDYQSTVTEQVRRILDTSLAGTWPTAEDVARRLAISPQHLRRRLHDEQTSLSQIREEVLRDAAVTSLARGTESVAELGRRLGFSEESAFRRAFRRWTGSPPSAYRRPPPDEREGHASCEEGS